MSDSFSSWIYWLWYLCFLFYFYFSTLAFQIRMWSKLICWVIMCRFFFHKTNSKNLLLLIHFSVDFIDLLNKVSLKYVHTLHWSQSLFLKSLYQIQTKFLTDFYIFIDKNIFLYKNYVFHKFDVFFSDLLWECGAGQSHPFMYEGKRRKGIRDWHFTC